MDATGHTEQVHETAMEAAAYVNEQKADGHIAYFDGQLWGGDKVTAHDLEGVQNIVLATPIRGG
jgi:hypothetical protein